MSTNKTNRTDIKDLPAEEKDLTLDEMAQVQGGADVIGSASAGREGNGVTSTTTTTRPCPMAACTLIAGHSGAHKFATPAG